MGVLGRSIAAGLGLLLVAACSSPSTSDTSSTNAAATTDDATYAIGIQGGTTTMPTQSVTPQLEVTSSGRRIRAVGRCVTVGTVTISVYQEGQVVLTLFGAVGGDGAFNLEDDLSTEPAGALKASAQCTIAVGTQSAHIVGPSVDVTPQGSSTSAQ